MHGQTCSRTRIIAESAKKARITNKAPDMHWESWTISRIPAEPEEAWSVTSRTPG